MGRTFSFYLARTFLKNILMVFFLFLGLIIVVDLIELSRELSKAKGVQFIDIAAVSILRAPVFAGHVIPFAVLFGAATSLIFLNKRLELVVARAAGVSVWQFLLPLVAVAALVGALNTMVYNPLALAGRNSSVEKELVAFGKAKGAFSNKTKNFWLRASQGEGLGDAIFRARVANQGGAALSAVSVYLFDKNGKVTERVDASSAKYVTENGKNFYALRNTTTFVPGAAAKKSDIRKISIGLSAAQLRQQTTDADDIQFWRLSEASARAEASGQNELPFDTTYYALLGQPLLFISMVFLAATFSLTFARFGQNEKLILGGIVAGFVLYIATKLVVTFGSNGLVSPLIAAWTPALVATLISITVLFHQEDG